MKKFGGAVGSLSISAAAYIVVSASFLWGPNTASGMVRNDVMFPGQAELRGTTGDAFNEAIWPFGLVGVSLDAQANVLYRHGVELYMGHDYAGAISIFSAALHIQPALVDALVGRSESYLARGTYTEAVADLDRALALRPGDARAFEDRGLAFSGMKKYRLAVADYDAALLTDPERATSLQERAYAHFQLKHYRQAIADCSSVLEHSGDSVRALYVRGVGHEALHEYAAAIADFSALITLRPFMAEAYYRRGSAYWNLGRVDLARVDFVAVLRIDPHHSLAYTARGLAEQRSGQDYLAMTDFTSALSENPRDANVIRWRADILYREGDYLKSIDEYSAALAIAPDSFWTLIDRGNSYTKIGGYERAIVDYSAAAKANPFSQVPYLDLANVYEKTGQYAIAILDAGEAIHLESDPERQASLYVFGSGLYEKENQFTKAIDDLTSAIRLKPDPATYTYRALDHEQLGWWLEAIKDMSSAISLTPGDAHLYQYRADYLVWIDADRQALSDYAQSLQLEPSYGATNLSRAELHFYRAEFAAAVLDFDEYFALRKDAPWMYAFIWRYLAAMRSRGDGVAVLMSEAESLGTHEWPYPVIEFYLGRIDEAALLAAARSGSAQLQADQVCEADAYIGELSLARGDPKGAISRLTRSLRECPVNFLEKLMAKRELRRM